MQAVSPTVKCMKITGTKKNAFQEYLFSKSPIAAFFFSFLKDLLNLIKTKD